MLKIENLNKKYKDKKILDDISFDTKKGSISIFLGKSGVGKSTLLRILNNLEKLDTGNIYIDGQKFDLSLANQKHLFGIVFQHFNLFEHLTAEENITLPLIKICNLKIDEAKKIAHDLLNKYELLEKKSNYPNELSGGQKQRLAIARTLALKPKILCLDEPTSALDPMLSNFVAQTITQLATEGYTILIATHDVKILNELKATIYYLEHGKIVQTAETSEFFKNKEKFNLINNFILGKI